MLLRSVKTLLMNAALGAGSELVIDVAQGVDWTAALAVVYGIQQVCSAIFAVLGLTV